MKNTTYKLQAMIHDYWHDGVEYHVYYDLLDKDETDMLLKAAMEISDEVESVLTTADSITKPVIAVAKGENGLLRCRWPACQDFGLLYCSAVPQAWPNQRAPFHDAA